MLVIFGYGPSISAAVARRFGGLGFRVALVARTRATLVTATAELSKSGITAGAFPCDLSDGSAIGPLIARIHSELGRIEALHWNVVGPSTSLISATAGAMDLQFDISVTGLLVAVQSALPQMRGHARAAVLVTAGASALPADYQAERAVSFGMSATAAAQEAKRAAARLLRFSLREDNIFVGEVIVAGVVGTDLPPSLDALKIEADAVADTFHALWRDRPFHDYSLTIEPGGVTEPTGPRVCRLESGGPANLETSLTPSLSLAEAPPVAHLESLVSAACLALLCCLFLARPLLALAKKRRGCMTPPCVTRLSWSGDSLSFQAAVAGTAIFGQVWSMRTWFVESVGVVWFLAYLAVAVSGACFAFWKAPEMPGRLPAAAAALLFYYGALDSVSTVHGVFLPHAEGIPEAENCGFGFPMTPLNHHVALYGAVRLLAATHMAETAIFRAGFLTFVLAFLARLMNTDNTGRGLVSALDEAPGLLLLSIHLLTPCGVSSLPTTTRSSKEPSSRSELSSAARAPTTQLH